MSKGQVRIYGCGGTGINIANNFIDADKGTAFAKLAVALIDTSESNLNEKSNDSNTYLLPEVDGSGKVRRDNHVVINDHIRKVLLQHKPAAMNIVVASASGGSGSVIGPLLLKELLEQGCPAIILMIGSSESSITATNTLNTLKSLEAIGGSLDKPVVMTYQHNGEDATRTEVDERVIGTIDTLAVMCSSNNGALDSRDIHNWLFYNHSTAVPAQLSLLEVFRTRDGASKVVAPISVASLLKDVDSPEPRFMAEYSCAGYPKEPLPGSLEEVHYVISVDAIKQLTLIRQEEVDEYTAATRSRGGSASNLVSASDKVEDSLLVL